MSKANEIKLGHQCRDIVTGFEGIVVSRIEYLDGRTAFGIQAKAAHDSKLPAVEYVSSVQCEKTGEGVHVDQTPHTIGFLKRR